jgi:hypothetical protein
MRWLRFWVKPVWVKPDDWLAKAPAKPHKRRHRC